VDGTPVIVEAHTPFYRWGSRISVNTGLPAVIGWDWHQTQQRLPYQAQIQQRIAEVASLYTGGTEQARAVIDRHGVRYIVVGQVERLYYPGPGLAKFESMPGITKVFAGETAIYRVER
jgi:uncharacterized membrane protein